MEENFKKYTQDIAQKILWELQPLIEHYEKLDYVKIALIKTAERQMYFLDLHRAHPDFEPIGKVLRLFSDTIEDILFEELATFDGDDANQLGKASLEKVSQLLF